eukprot:scaffold1954_cov364-Prasinococcus_capsulatus_cf.AAC.7
MPRAMCSAVCAAASGPRWKQLPPSSRPSASRALGLRLDYTMLSPFTLRRRAPRAWQCARTVGSAETPETMRAIRYQEYGEPSSVLRLKETPVPALQDGTVLIKVKAAAVSPIDLKTVKGYMQATIKKELPATLGTDVAGVVVGVGSGCTRLKVGDEVFADLTPRLVLAAPRLRSAVGLLPELGSSFDQATRLIGRIRSSGGKHRSLEATIAFLSGCGSLPACGGHFLPGAHQVH